MCPKPPKLETIMEEAREMTLMQERTVEDAPSSTEAPLSTDSEKPELGKQRHTSMSSSSSGTVLSSGSEATAFDERLIEFLGKAIESVARDGDLHSSPHISEKDAFIGAAKVPQISIRSYLKRMLKYIDGRSGGSLSWDELSLGARSLIFALIYVDRLASRTKLVINSCRIHRLVAAGILVALKMNEDDIIDMNYFSLLAGIPVSQLSALEKVFLDKIEFQTFVGEAEFHTRVDMFDRLDRLCSKKERRSAQSRQ